MHFEHAIDGAGNTCFQIFVGADADLARDVVGVEQRHSAAGGLLGATVGVAVEFGE